MTASPTAPAAVPSEGAPIELWLGDRKVSIYRDIVIRVWGSSPEFEMSDTPRTHQSVNDAVEWLFAPILAEKERLEREWASEKERADMATAQMVKQNDRILAAEAALAATGNAKATYFDGKLIICHPDMPPHIWDGKAMQKVETSQQPSGRMGGGS